MDTDWSVMEGNDWLENDDGSFSIDQNSFSDSYGYSPLDLYTMGLIPATAVPEMFIIENPSGANRNPASPPEFPFGSGNELTLYGDKLSVTMDQIEAVEGIRLPQWNESPRRFKVAMFVLSRYEQDMNATQIDQALDYATWMEEDFAINTRNLAKLDLGTGAAPANQAPVASIDAQTEVKQGKPLTLDATKSSDPENHKLAYVWDFGDGTGDFEAGPVVEHVYKNRGTYTVTLVAVDREGAVGQTQMELTVTKAKESDTGLLGCTCAMAPANRQGPISTSLFLFSALGLGLALVRRRLRRV
jgi:hypothetical protein